MKRRKRHAASGLVAYLERLLRVAGIASLATFFTSTAATAADWLSVVEALSSSGPQVLPASFPIDGTAPFRLVPPRASHQPAQRIGESSTPARTSTASVAKESTGPSADEGPVGTVVAGAEKVDSAKRDAAGQKSDGEKKEEKPEAPDWQVERDRIYHGDPDDFARPAWIEAEKVYSEIPSYRKIQQNDLDRDDPEYWPLMRRAAARFVRALRAACGKTGHDLVGEIDSIRAEGAEVPEITDEVIECLAASGR